MSDSTERRTQADRRAKTRESVLSAAARGLSKFGYASLALEHVARDAGYTRGAVYHQFANKEVLVLSVVEWVSETWDEAVRRPALAEGDPLVSLIAMARGHAHYCRRSPGASVMLTLRVEFTGQDHPIGRALEEIYGRLETECAGLIDAGRRTGTIPAGPPARLTAATYLTVLESVGIELQHEAPHDVELLERAVRGILGVAPVP
ncbi:TetR family transcriptional regulator [Agromyces sp. CFH 90414]|uniref:TetR family transcriptional regulator n=1 Tax=Agromyces agglutinans TaxID=2662258 RepID=A0A6I2F0M7_9MICO|nr:TetR/AcrR family transcriptional regulator [Agromyces agglutinans]MRG58995.1 TetR family transcriptional regulator [Agromyces agglutinans]